MLNHSLIPAYLMPGNWSVCASK